LQLVEDQLDERGAGRRRGAPAVAAVLEQALDTVPGGRGHVRSAVEDLRNCRHRHAGLFRDRRQRHSAAHLVVFVHDRNIGHARSITVWVNGCMTVDRSPGLTYCPSAWTFGEEAETFERRTMKTRARLPRLVACGATLALALGLTACGGDSGASADGRSEEHTSELQSRENLVCRL